MICRLLLASAVALTMASCSRTVCGTGTVARFDRDTGITECVALGGSLACDPASAVIVNGVCQADPSKYPTCGPGTQLDLVSNRCLPVGSGIALRRCAAQQAADTVCLYGVIRSLRNDTFPIGTTFEVRAYDPLAFRNNPQGTPPLAMTTTNDATYVLDNVRHPGGLGIVAVAVVDPSGTNYVLGAVGLQGTEVGGRYRIDAFAVERSLVALWDQAAGLGGPTSFLAQGAYLGLFIDQIRGREAEARPVAGVTLHVRGQPVTPQHFFRGDRATLDASLSATDAATGAVLVKGQGLDNFTGAGGTIGNSPVSWETVPGASVPGVVFIQLFHPQS